MRNGPAKAVTTLTLPLTLRKQAPNPLQIILAQGLIVDHLREQESRGALEWLCRQIAHGAAPRSLPDQAACQLSR